MSSSSAEIKASLESLSESLEGLQSALEPLLSTATNQLSTPLPLLDKAKLHVLTAYAIESLLFSAIRLQGVDAKQHAIFAELARTRQYFEKIQKADKPLEQPTMRLDKGAATRFIKASLDKSQLVRQMTQPDKRKADATERNSEKEKKNKKARTNAPKSSKEAFQSLLSR